MDSKATRVQKMFSSIANRYDLFNTVSSFNRDSYWRRFAVNHTGVGQEALVLDVGVGTGKLVSELVRQRGANAIGVDLCEDMLIRAKDVALDGTAGFAMARAECLPFPDDVFDCAISGFTLRNVSDLRNTLEEMVRVVKVGGRVVCLEFTPPSRSLGGVAYRGYLATLLPLLGCLVSGRRAPYTYLPQSIKEFQSPEELKQTMEEVGLTGVEFYLLTLGTVAVHVGTKVGQPL
jgi:demethylmenaquinone methyltransferase/2-methoxy-6-polyprenyl-1,4-benzoquinol methylase